ncbi:MAG: hypothetical protein NTZ46_08850, partial [Verrucomicrobia bacterium]|nr:hypothetical protein [Verrucomicrobiota bacterium]
KEREKSELLERMAENEEIGEVTVEEEPVADASQENEVTTAAAETAQATERIQAREAVARDFPEAIVEGTEFFEACREELAYLREAQSPLADDPQVELKIARRMARVLGYSQRAAVQEVPQVAVKSTPQRRSVRPMPTGGAPVESPVTTLERRVSGAKSTGLRGEIDRGDAGVDARDRHSL